MGEYMDCDSLEYLKRFKKNYYSAKPIIRKNPKEASAKLWYGAIDLINAHASLLGKVLFKIEGFPILITNETILNDLLNYVRENVEEKYRKHFMNMLAYTCATMVNRYYLTDFTLGELLSQQLKYERRVKVILEKLIEERCNAQK